MGCFAIMVRDARLSGATSYESSIGYSFPEVEGVSFVARSVWTEVWVAICSVLWADFEWSGSELVCVYVRCCVSCGDSECTAVRVSVLEFDWCHFLAEVPVADS